MRDSRNGLYELCNLSLYAIAIKTRTTLLCQANNFKVAGSDHVLATDYEGRGAGRSPMAEKSAQSWLRALATKRDKTIHRDGFFCVLGCLGRKLNLCPRGLELRPTGARIT